MYVEQRGGQYSISTCTIVRWFIDEVTMRLKQRCRTSVYVTIQLYNKISCMESQGLSNISCLTLRLAFCFSSSLLCWAWRRITSASCSLSSFSYWSGETVSRIVTMADVLRSFFRFYFHYLITFSKYFLACCTSIDGRRFIIYKWWYSLEWHNTHWFHQSVWPGCAQLERARLWRGRWARRWDVSAARRDPRLSRSPPGLPPHGALLRASALSQQTAEGLQNIKFKRINSRKVCQI